MHEMCPNTPSTDVKCSLTISCASHATWIRWSLWHVYVSPQPWRVRDLIVEKGFELRLRCASFTPSCCYPSDCRTSCVYWEILKNGKNQENWRWNSISTCQTLGHSPLWLGSCRRQCASGAMPCRAIRGLHVLVVLALTPSSAAQGGARRCVRSKVNPVTELAVTKPPTGQQVPVILR